MRGRATSNHWLLARERLRRIQIPNVKTVVVWYRMLTITSAGRSAQWEVAGGTQLQILATWGGGQDLVCGELGFSWWSNQRFCLPRVSGGQILLVWLLSSFPWLNRLLWAHKVRRESCVDLLNREQPTGSKTKDALEPGSSSHHHSERGDKWWASR